MTVTMAPADKTYGAPGGCPGCKGRREGVCACGYDWDRLVWAFRVPRPPYTLAEVLDELALRRR